MARMAKGVKWWAVLSTLLAVGTCVAYGFDKDVTLLAVLTLWSAIMSLHQR